MVHPLGMNRMDRQSDFWYYTIPLLNIFAGAQETITAVAFLVKMFCLNKLLVQFSINKIFLGYLSLPEVEHRSVFICFVSMYCDHAAVVGNR